MKAIDPTALVHRIEVLAKNLRWSWCSTTTRLFAALDPVSWRSSNHDPLALLRTIGVARLAACAEDAGILNLLSAAEHEHDEYFRTRTWFERTVRGKRKKARIAYFCSEYAIHESMPQYSGGLGVLAGDHLKSASDLGIPLCAVGLLYQHGYYRQELRADGTTRVLYPLQRASDMPLEDTGVEIECPIGARHVRTRIWIMRVGRIPVYLLDTNVAGARKADRELTQGLYKGEALLRMRQQILLGVGGVMALDAIGEAPSVFHLNEGHAAFANIERWRRLAHRMPREEALELVRKTSVFTTHTPVPAGHDRYDPRSVAREMRTALTDLGIPSRDFGGLGRERPDDKQEPFCMTVLALRTSEYVNGVSALHGEVSREMWRNVYAPAHVPIGHITNGVHTRTWLPPETEALYAKTLRPAWNGASPDFNCWSRVDRITDEALWGLRTTLRKRLVAFVRERLEDQARRRGADEAEIHHARSAFDESALTIGFARRFATYKRANLIFSNLKRLTAILGARDQPVQIVFAGKAHPRDIPGQDLAKKIYRIAQRAGLRAHVALIEEYDMNVGRTLTAGCDVWLNTPVRPQEASGTSGMKPPLSGGLNLSILDGWWPESYNKKNGWAIKEGKGSKRRDAADAAKLYEILEEQVVPLFYKRTRAGLPKQWIARMRCSLRTVPPQFSAHRMVGDYWKTAYAPASDAAQ